METRNSKAVPANAPGGFGEIAPGVWSRLGPVEIRDRLARVDIAVLDVDECLLPGYTQIELGTLLFRKMLRELPRRPSRLGPFSRLAGLGLLLYAIKLSPLEHERRNTLLQRYFSRALAGVAREEIETLVPGVWRRLHPGAPACVRGISRCLPVGVISLGWDVIVAGLPAALAGGDNAFRFLFAKANATGWRQGRFQGLQPPVLTGAADKEGFFADFCRSHGFQAPLVLGHNSDERLLCRLADSLGGLSIGLGARGRDRTNFHLLLQRGDWQSLDRFFHAFRVEWHDSAPRVV